MRVIGKIVSAVKFVGGMIANVQQIECPAARDRAHLSPVPKVALRFMMFAVTSLMSRGDINAAPAFVNGVMVFNLILRGDGLMA